MKACSGNICDALCCCSFSYHALLSLHYESCPVKTTAAKKLAQETGISVREAERYLDANVFLDECLRWPPLGSHHPFIMHWKPQGKKSTIGPFIRASDSPPPNETWGWSLPPWNSLGLRLGRYIMKCIN